MEKLLIMASGGKRELTPEQKQARSIRSRDNLRKLRNQGKCVDINLTKHTPYYYTQKGK
jgi:hypothetical protein